MKPLQLTCFGVLFLLHANCFAQTAAELSSMPNDSTKVQLMYDIAWQLEIEQPDSAIALYQEGAAISKAIGYEMGLGRGLQYEGIVQSDQGQYDAALEKYQQAIAVFDEIPYPTGTASTYVNIGLIQKRRAEFVDAFQNFLSGTKILEELQDTTRLIMAYTAMGAIMLDVEQYDKAKEYQTHALNLAKDQKDSIGICDGLVNLGSLDVLEKREDRALTRLLEGNAIAKAINDTRSLALTYNGLCEIYSIQEKPELALENGKQAVYYAEMLGNPAIESMALARTGMNFQKLDQYDSAHFYLEKSIAIAEKHQIRESLRFSHLWYSNLLEAEGQHQNALEYFKSYEKLEQQETGDRRMRIVSGLQMQYETEKKDLEIANQQMKIERNEAELNRRNSMIISLVVALGLAFAIFILIRRGLVQRRKLAEQEAQLKEERVQQMEQEQEVIALKSIMDGEERERTRLAKDLHDGLGGLLSATKLHFSKGDSNQSNSEDRQKGLDLIDKVSTEARRISHNLMPEALSKFGLASALEDYCQSVQQSSGKQINFQSYHLEERLNKDLEINAFRIVQELVNNAIKHSEAEEIIVQLMKVENELHVTVEDNGKGFKVDQTVRDGIGMASVQSRVDVMKGSLEIESEIQKGSSFMMRFPIKLEAES